MNEDGHVLKSRRGLLAAGLAVAVVGALGVASTLQAGAEQIPDAQPATTALATDPSVATATTAAADAAADTDALADLAPPTKLPWGERPVKISRGRGGATSKTLRAAGLDAAPADASGSVLPRAKFAPKGRSAKTTFLKSERTNIVPPQPAALPGAVAPEPPDGDQPKVNFLYNVGSQQAETDGFYANVTIAKPALGEQDYHTLAELAVQSADGQQIVEVGWNVDRVVNGDDDPHLFVYHWVDRQTSCYNGCGFQQYSKNIKPGDTLSYDVTKKFGIQYSDGAWWVAFDSEWVGYFPEKLWNDEGVDFSRSGFLQVFGEIATSTDESCSEMGNGKKPDKDVSARVSSVSFLDGPPVALSVRSTTDQFSVSQLSGKTFRYGGPVPGEDC
ncbi:neprosin family prolyl endopeptidase [Micromonosporaceae bacterium Da 78-11]